MDHESVRSVCIAHCYSHVPKADDSSIKQVQSWRCNLGHLLSLSVLQFPICKMGIIKVLNYMIMNTK